MSLPAPPTAPLTVLQPDSAKTAPKSSAAKGSLFVQPRGMTSIQSWIMKSISTNILIK